MSNTFKQNMVMIISVLVVYFILWYFIFRKKTEEESDFKLPRWLKIGGCRPCLGSPNDGCCGGCVCKDYTKQ